MITKVRKTRTNGKLPRTSSICSELIDVDNFSVITGGANGFSGHYRTSQVPLANVRESENHVIVEMAVPGFKKQDVQVDIQGRTLNISIDKEDDLSEDERYTKLEFNYNSFERNFLLPEWVDTEEVNATYDSGMVRILIAKKEDARIQKRKKVEFDQVLN